MCALKVGVYRRKKALGKAEKLQLTAALRADADAIAKKAEAKRREAQATVSDIRKARARAGDEGE